MITYKAMPMAWGEDVWEIVIRKHDYPKNELGNDVDFSIMLRKNGEWVSPREYGIEKMIFVLCRYLWNTSQPVQNIIEDNRPEEDPPETRWQSIARESN